MYYNSTMTRKKRSDRNHAIYIITNTLTGEQYIGITAISNTVKQALHVRIRKHIQRAFSESKNWGLCESIRKYGTGNFTYGLVEIVRGKRECHLRETQLIKQYNPILNTFK
jgi:Putative endonuclease segE, GIY-YIG domain